MNPLLLGSDIAALNSVIAAAISSTFKYASSVTHAKKEQKEFLDELCALKIPLDKLLSAISNTNASSPDCSDAAKALRLQLSRCKTDAEKWQRMIERNIDSKKGKVIWPFQKPELEKMIKKLKDYQVVFNNALAIDMWNIMALTDSKVNTLLEIQEKHHRDAKNNKVINWLAKYIGNYEVKNKQIKKTRVPDTGFWFLQLPELQGFMQHGNDEYRLLWCHGLPGAGKSHLACCVIDTLEKTFKNDPSSAVLYWYFDYSSPQERTLILSSFLMQLIGQIPTLPDTIVELYENKGKGRGKDTGPDTSVLMREIDALLKKFKQSFVVLDAMDECIRDFQNEASEIVNHLQNIGARILITSRQTDPGKTFSGWIPLEIKAHTEDIRRLIDYNIANGCYEVMQNNELKEEVIETIASKTDGMFLWASLQLDEVLDSSTVSEIREVLHNMPKNISRFFSRTMSRIANNGFALRTLLWLAYAKNPLSFDALSHALSIQLDKGFLKDINRDNIPHIDTLVKKCFGLIVKDGENNLRLAHFSILEYLKSNPQEFKFHKNPDLYIAKVCLRYLSMDVFETKCVYGDKAFGERIRNYPLLEYAAKRWRWHVPHETEIKTLKSEILHLYSNERLFQNYINAYYPWSTGQTLLPGMVEPYFYEIRGTRLYNAVELQLRGVICHLLKNKEMDSLQENARATLLMRAIRDNKKDLVGILRKAGIVPSIKGYGPEASEWNIFRHATNDPSRRQDSIDSLQKDKVFYKELYPSTLAIIMGHRNIFKMLIEKDNLAVIGDILTRAVEDEDNGRMIVKKMLREYPSIDHKHPIYVGIMERRGWELYFPKGEMPREQEREILLANKRGMLQALLDARPQLDNTDGLLDKLLPSAISYLPKQYVQMFLNKGAGRDASDHSSKALLAAIEQKDEQLVILLVSRGAKVSARVFQEVVSRRMKNLVIYMLDKGYDASAEKKDVSANIESIGLYEDRTALHIAVEEDTTITRILLENGANPNAQSVEFGTPLAIASFDDNEPVIELLIKYKADINCVRDPRYGSALCAAASNCSLRACRLLLDNHADPNCIEALPLLAAIEPRDNILVIKMLLDRGADPMKKNRKQEYPLEEAVYHGRDDIVQLFLKHGATLDAYGRRGSILHAAAASKKKGMVQIMLDLGAKVKEYPDKFGSILQWARPEDYQLLIENGVKTNPPVSGYRRESPKPSVS
ncbi:hypothetical protein H0G86_003586 [Trichoderma simmonsii]|nr:hypothetical protein H0G86_003586 [Trichoderma simmonsii]